MKYDYFADDTEKIEKRRRRFEKRASFRKFLKVLLITLGIIVLILTAAWALLRYVFVDFYFSNVVPDNAVASYIDEDIIGKTTVTETTVTQTTLPTYESMTYLDSSFFELERDKKGGLIGNNLNGGKVCGYNSNAYHIVDGSGIYRFNPYGETYECVVPYTDSISSLNAYNDYLYFVDDKTNMLCKANKGTSVYKIAPNIKTAYIYDSKVYCVSAYDQIMSVDAVSGDARVLFSAKKGQTLTVIGASSDRVFFTLKYPNDRTEYLTVDTLDGSTKSFNAPSYNDSIINMSMENGYLYYFQRRDNGNYNLIRRKFGSQQTVTLVENKAFCSYAVTDSNRVFYSYRDGDTVYLDEYNMNSSESKTMLTAKAGDSKNTLQIYHSGEYDFIIGDGVYRASSNLTSSTNVMTFSNGRWSY